MLDFLRRLAPPELRAAEPARAVLPPRFAATGGLAPPDAPEPAGAVANGEVASSATAWRRQSADARFAAAREAPQPADPTEPRRPAPAPAAAPLAGTHAVPPPPERSGVVRAGRAVAPAFQDSVVGRSAAMPLTRPQPFAPARHGPATLVTADGATTDARPTASAPPSPARAAAQAAVAALPRPLLRPQAPAAPAPVIHVTIDRIEVRTPSAAPRPANTPRQRAAAPSVSLADYLRGGAGPRRGGAA